MASKGESGERERRNEKGRGSDKSNKRRRAGLTRSEGAERDNQIAANGSEEKDVSLGDKDKTKAQSKIDSAVFFAAQPRPGRSAIN